MKQDNYWTIENGKKIYFINNLRFESEYDAIKYFIKRGLSSTQSHKVVSKIKKLKIKGNK